MPLSNLPPGVKESDIPGNRPDDIRFELMFDEVQEEHPDWSDDQVAVEAEDRIRQQDEEMLDAMYDEWQERKREQMYEERRWK